MDEWRNDYVKMRDIPNQGLCGLAPMIFTIGLFCHLDSSGYRYRYCFKSMTDAIYAIENWDGNGHPPGIWIKRKGKGGDIPNPNLE